MTGREQSFQQGQHLIGQMIGGYHIEQKVGQGGMAWVYKATHLASGGIYALKVLFPALSYDHKLRMRFRREAALQSQLVHPHIVRVIEIIEQDGLLCIVQEWCDSGDLAQWIKQRPAPLTGSQLHGLMQPILDAVDALHKVGLIHRDLKPQNVLLHEEAGALIPKLTDFGIARDTIHRGPALTQAGSIVGTLQYMSPEQIEQRQDLDHRSDIYSLGVMMYELCAGRRPFEGDLPSLLFQILQQNPPALLDPPGLFAHVLCHCLAKQPAHRYQDVPSLQAALALQLPTATPLYKQPEPPSMIGHTKTHIPQLCQEKATTPQLCEPSLMWDDTMTLQAPAQAVDKPARVFPIFWMALVLGLGFGLGLTWGQLSGLHPSLMPQHKAQYTSQPGAQAPQDTERPKGQSLIPPAFFTPQKHKRVAPPVAPSPSQPLSRRQAHPFTLAGILTLRKNKLQRLGYRTKRRTKRRRRQKHAKSHHVRRGARWRCASAAQCYNLAKQLLRMGKADKKQARSLLQRACQMGHSSACRRFAQAWQWGIGGAGSCVRANKWFRRACRLGDQRSCRQHCIELPLKRDLFHNHAPYRRRAYEGGQAL